MKISISVLAGGKSSRMGANKALLAYNNTTFLNHILREMHSFDEVLISVDEKNKYRDFDYKLIEDEHKDIGPIEGIYQALKNAQNDYVFVCATDMPFIQKELVDYMMEFISSDYDCYVLKEGDRVHPLCAIYSKKALPYIEKLIDSGKYKLIEIFNLVRTKYIDLSLSCFDEKVVKNINTKEEYREIKKPIVFAVSAIKDSGKTGLIIKLINEFIIDGFKVGVIKHDGHEFVIDVKGTDTYRFMEAKASATAIYSASKQAIIRYDKSDFYDLLNSMSDLDIVIIEGMKNSKYPKVEVVRKGISTETVCDEKSLICVATNVSLTNKPNCPIYDIDDTSGIYTCIKNFFVI